MFVNGKGRKIRVRLNLIPGEFVMYGSTTNPSELNRSVQYECEDCEITFCLLDSQLVCPGCASRDLNHFVIVYKEDDESLDEMMTDSDLSAGD
jgi:Zn finger protein HypA/HybF involved in hydrogenase expression